MKAINTQVEEFQQIQSKKNTKRQQRNSIVKLLETKDQEVSLNRIQKKRLGPGLRDKDEAQFLIRS